MTKLKGKDMEKWMKCYVGTNSLRGSKGIYTLEINTQNGEMREVSTVEADDSAYLYVSEKRKCLYVDCDICCYISILFDFEVF